MPYIRRMAPQPSAPSNHHPWGIGFTSWVLVASLAVLTGCGSDDASAGGARDAGRDASDASHASDALLPPADSQADAGTDANTSADAATDAAPPTDTTLAQEAATLAPGQSRRLTTELPASVVHFNDEGADFIQWGSSAVYDPTRREVSFIGKRHSTYPYHWLLYDEDTNAWSNDRAVWSSDVTFGHGYDHSTIDPQTGTLWHRPYNARVVYQWDGAWSELPSIDSSIASVGGLSWFPGVGLVYADNARIVRYHEGSWTQLANFGQNGSHDVLEYNSTAHVLLFGVGGTDNAALHKISASLQITPCAKPPIDIGAGAQQGLFTADPRSATAIAWGKGSGEWHEYDITKDSWRALSASTGDGAAPQDGLPPLVGIYNWSAIAAPIPEYGVIMYIQRKGSEVEVWLYRHS